MNRAAEASTGAAEAGRAPPLRVRRALTTPKRTGATIPLTGESRRRQGPALTLSPSLAATVTVLMLRADAGATLGVGHVMRCLALGQAWIAAGGEARLASVDLPERLRLRLESAGVPTLALDADHDPSTSIAAAAAACGAQVVVFDAPAIGWEVHERVRAAGWTVAVIEDDARASRYAADVLINQNLYADAATYALLAPMARRLCGPDYVLLRQEFCGSPAPRRSFARRAERLLLTFGGADPRALTESTIGTLITAGMTRRMKLTVVLGPANPRADAIRRALLGHGRLVVDPPSMLQLMGAADLAISAGGSTVYELAFAGLPMVLGAVTPMEARLGEAMAAAGAARFAGAFDAALPARLAQLAAALADDELARVELAARAQALVDGAGATRVVAALTTAAANRRRAA